MACAKIMKDELMFCGWDRGSLVRYYIIALSVLLLDQVTKWLVIRKMDLYESIPLLDGVFYITSHRNSGAAFGILQGQQWLFIPITVLVVAFLIYYLARLRNSHPLASWSFALLLGGAVGNLIDRIRFGEVVDFLDFRLINFPIFNVADSAIVIGVTFLIWETLKNPEQKKEKDLSETGDTQ